jgi:hypothetical protein
LWGFHVSAEVMEAAVIWPGEIMVGFHFPKESDSIAPERVDGVWLEAVDSVCSGSEVVVTIVCDIFNFLL